MIKFVLGIVVGLIVALGLFIIYNVKQTELLAEQEIRNEFEHRFGMEPKTWGEQTQYAIEDEFSNKLERLCNQAKFIHQQPMIGVMADAGARTAEQLRRMEFLTTKYGYKIPEKAEQFKIHLSAWKPQDSFENLKCFDD